MINKFSLDKKKAKEILPKRPKNANKGTFGRALIIAGSRKMVGCCELAVSGAFRCGVGLVTLAFPDCIYDTVTLRLTENTFMPLPSHNGELSKECITELLNEVNNFDVVVFGCGLGRSSDIKEILGELILKSRKPLIIDADGLNALAEIKEALKSAECDILLTPHPGEMSRLIKRDVDYIEKNREKVVNEFCKEYNVNVLLKGNNTIISDSSATSVCINKTGNTGLSKGGSGDLLSGMIAGLTPSLKGSLYKSACLGTYIHGLSAELASKEISEFSTLQTDCAKKIGEVIKIISESE
jgi:NAD(P)H-hydrate epimerase